MRAIAYIAAPYAAPTPDLVAWNVARAALLGRLAIAEGFAPVVVHHSIEALFGAETPITRALGLDCDAAIVDMIARRASSQLFVLLRDDGSATGGMIREHTAWQHARGQSGRDLLAINGVRVGTWAIWHPLARRANLGPAWAALADAPGNRREAM